MNTIDLHCHTTASDGKYTPTQLVQMAAEMDLRTIAVCDHDSTEGLAEALTIGAKLGVEVVPSVELSCDVAEGELHMLGYYPDYSNAAFQAELSRLREGRVGRAEGMVRKLVALGYPITFERVQQLAGDGSIGRPHVAQALIEAGSCATKTRPLTSSSAATARPTSSAPGCRRPTPAGWCAASAACRSSLIRSSSWRTVTQRSRCRLMLLFRSWWRPAWPASRPYYPSYTPGHIERLRRLARQYGLIVTGGSDFHGEGSAGAPLGSIYVPAKCLTALKQAHAAAASALN